MNLNQNDMLAHHFKQTVQAQKSPSVANPAKIKLLHCTKLIV